MQKELNNKMQEQKVGFDNAKLLKEKGFDCINPPIFYIRKTINTGTPMYNGNGTSYLSSMPKLSIKEGHYYSPTQQVAIDWIRINFNVEIHVGVNFYNKSEKLGYYYSIDKFTKANIHDGKDYDMNQINLLGDTKAFDTPEEAKEAAINHVLTILI
jgi:hypothetical protein